MKIYERTYRLIIFDDLSSGDILSLDNYGSSGIIFFSNWVIKLDATHTQTSQATIITWTIELQTVDHWNKNTVYLFVVKIK